MSDAVDVVDGVPFVDPDKQRELELKWEQMGRNRASTIDFETKPASTTLIGQAHDDYEEFAAASAGLERTHQAHVDAQARYRKALERITASAAKAAR